MEMKRKILDIHTFEYKHICRQTHTECNHSEAGLLTTVPPPPSTPVFYYSCGRETDHNSWSQQKAADREREMEGGTGRRGEEKKERAQVTVHFHRGQTETVQLSHFH